MPTRLGNCMRHSALAASVTSQVVLFLLPHEMDAPSLGRMTMPWEPSNTGAVRR